MNVQELATAHVEKIAQGNHPEQPASRHGGAVEDNSTPATAGTPTRQSRIARRCIRTTSASATTSNVPAEQVIFLGPEGRAPAHVGRDPTRPQHRDPVFPEHVLPFIPAGRTVADMKW